MQQKVVEELQEMLLKWFSKINQLNLQFRQVIIEIRLNKQLILRKKRDFIIKLILLEEK